MNLFDIIPENYFGLFGGKNKAIYLDSLMVLYNLLESDEAFIKKSDFVKTLRERGKELESFTYEDEEFDATQDNSLLAETASGKAGYIVKRLEETGWIDVMMDPDTFEESIIMPQYSILILKAFKDIISDEESPYMALVHATYSELKLEDEEQDELMYATLSRCYDNTKRLKVELITINHSIRIFQNRLSKLFDTNRVLHDYFDIYKNKIVDRYYHPLKTFDSVAKFKRPIIRILDKWINDRNLREKITKQAVLSNPTETREAMEADVIEKINYITDTYEKLNATISSIDKENNAYTKSSANKILYLNNNDKTIKGHLENILKEYAKSTNDPRRLRKILTKMQDSIYFYEQGYINGDSLTLPILRKIREDDLPMELVSFDDAADFLMSDFIEETRLIFTDEKVYGFMELAFGDKQEINISEIPIVDTDAFICLILAVIKKDDENCFYWVEEVDKTKIHSYGYIVPNFKFIRKE
ncbi:MAG: hypothetical protein IJ186_03215 [Bacilli bacterium]|nr:hypothetical protein [Bacilli bacterium]